MKGKAIDFLHNEFQSDLQCNKHPSSQQTQIGICPYCLRDRLLNLICSDCGEQRLSSCSCSSGTINSDHRNSLSAVDVGSVGRVSFLIENDQDKKVDAFNLNPNPNLKPKNEEIGVFLLKRSNSSCVEIKRRNGFWRIGRKLFRKKKSEFSPKLDDDRCVKSVVDEKNENWVVDYMGVSRSRSLCSFRGGGGGGGWWSENGGGDDLMAFSGARSSISAARSSSVFDPERKSGFSEIEPRRSGFDSDQRRDSTASGGGGGGYNRRVFSLKESYFTNGEDTGFIDLKFDSSSDQTKPELSNGRNSGFGNEIECGGGLNSYGGGSCRFDNRGIKRSRKSFKGTWRWIFQAKSKHEEER